MGLGWEVGATSACDCLLCYCKSLPFCFTAGPDLVAFLKKRREEEVKGAMEMETAMEKGEPQDGGEPEGTPRDTLPPEVKEIEGSWLHMDVTEAQKLEWMTDTPVTRQDEVGGVRPLLACDLLAFSPAVGRERGSIFI